jgi:hypothetical protein
VVRITPIGITNRLSCPTVTDYITQHKDIHKLTWAKHGSKPISDYVIGNKKIWPYKTNGKIINKMRIKFISLFYVNSLLHVSALLGDPQGDSSIVA